MNHLYNACMILFISMTFWLPQVFGASVFCGPNPVANTTNLQKAISNAGNHDTLVLPPGVCLLAKCEVVKAEKPATVCTGESGPRSALYLGNGLNSNLQILGDPSGTSVLKLDPNPPKRDPAGPPPNKHYYCRDNYVFTIDQSSHVTLRGFTIDGSHQDLPVDTRECPNDKGGYDGFAERMHALNIEDSTDVDITDMRLINAHGDGLNLIADAKTTTDTRSEPLTERITVTNTRFLGNKRTGIAFQRNVSQVTVTGNLFRNSGTDQDIDMESSGDKENDKGPSEIYIMNNVFERIKPVNEPSGRTVHLGAGSTGPGRGIHFTGNTIKPAAGSDPKHGGCIWVYNAEKVEIRGNTITGARKCETIRAEKATSMAIEDNKLHGYKIAQRSIAESVFQLDPSGVVSIAVRTAKNDETCGRTTVCTYSVHYPEDIIIRNNEIVQHVPFSTGIQLEGADQVIIANNKIKHEKPVQLPSSLLVDQNHPRAAGVAVTIGVEKSSGDVYEGEKRMFASTDVQGTTLSNFKHGILLQRRERDPTISSVMLSGNSLSSTVGSPKGIYIKDTSPFIGTLTVRDNLFGCGLVVSSALAPDAFVLPVEQPYRGLIGSAIPGNPAPCF